MVIYLKKLLIVLLTFTIVFSLVACSNNISSNVSLPTEQTNLDTSNTTNTHENVSVNKQETVTPTEIESETDEQWIVRDVAKPVMEDLIVEEKLLADMISFNIAKTPFDINLDEVIQSVKNLDYVKENYTDFAHSKSDVMFPKHFTDIGCYFGYSISESYGANFKNKENQKVWNYYQDLSIIVDSYTYEYSNPCEIRIIFNGIPELTPQFQENVYMIAKEVFGESAEFLVYGKDQDGKKLNGHGLEDIELSDCSDYVDFDKDAVYAFARQFDYYDDTGYTLTLSVYVYQNPYAEITKDYYAGNHEPLYNTLPHNLTTLLSSDFGETDIFNYNKMGDKYFKSMPNEYDYEFSNLRSLSVSSDYMFDGITQNEIFLKLWGNYEHGSANELTYSIKYVEQADKSISYVDLSVTGETNSYKNIIDDRSQTNKGVVCEAIYEDIRNAISTIMPELDLTSVVYDTTENEYPRNYSSRYKIDTEFLGCPAVATISICIYPENNLWKYGTYHIRVEPKI